MVLRIEPKAFHMLYKYCITELCPYQYICLEGEKRGIKTNVILRRTREAMKSEVQQGTSRI